MAKLNVITSMLDDLFAEQPIHTALSIGQQLETVQDTSHLAIQWHYFNATEFLNLPFTERYDLAMVILTGPEFIELKLPDISRLLVKLRDLMAKRIIVVGRLQDEQLLRSLGFTQLVERTENSSDFALWQFNILTYKHVPDWFNSKYWANPENWDKYRW